MVGEVGVHGAAVPPVGARCLGEAGVEVDDRHLGPQDPEAPGGGVVRVSNGAAGDIEGVGAIGGDEEHEEGEKADQVVVVPVVGDIDHEDVGVKDEEGGDGGAVVEAEGDEDGRRREEQEDDAHKLTGQGVHPAEAEVLEVEVGIDELGLDGWYQLPDVPEGEDAEEDTEEDERGDIDGGEEAVEEAVEVIAGAGLKGRVGQAGTCGNRDSISISGRM